MAATSSVDVFAVVEAHLPYLRRYARALTGSQEAGDGYAVAALTAVIENPAVIAGVPDPKVGLYRALHGVWSSGGSLISGMEQGIAAKAQERLSRVTPNSREALLLHTVESFPIEQVAEILGLPVAEADRLVEQAVAEMSNEMTGTVLVIEDEAIIAMDISAIVEDMGHEVTGIARTHTQAVVMAVNNPPNLVLADIQLADNSSGVDAVNDILKKFSKMPVIFVTAFPERLLTGERKEPAFLITKPYTEEQIRSAVSQAMFFASTETLV